MIFIRPPILNSYIFQLKLLVLTNVKARAIVEKSKQKRFDILFEIFKMAGQNDEAAACSSRK